MNESKKCFDSGNFPYERYKKEQGMFVLNIPCSVYKYI